MIRGMSRHALLIVAGWLAAAAAAIGTGLAGVQVIGGGITTGSGGDVLTSAEAADQLARAGPPPAAPSTASPSATQSGFWKLWEKLRRPPRIRSC